MSRSRWFAVWHFVCVAAGIAAAATWFAPASAQRRSGPVTIASRTTNDLRDWGSRIDVMRRARDLRVRTTREDELIPGRTHQRFDQFHRGVRVFGADVAEQLNRGQVLSVFGNLYEDINVDSSPSIDADRARVIVAERTDSGLAPLNEPELVVLPRNGGYTLTWRVRAFKGLDIREYFVDARSGDIVLDYSNRPTQSAVGTAQGVLGDTKKISVLMNASTGIFFASDRLRPPALRTYDFQGNPIRTLQFLTGAISGDSDIASDSDNNWTDGAVGDGHIYAGWTYDYYFKRFNRRGLNDANRGEQIIVHPVRRADVFTQFDDFADFYVNAFYAGGGVVVFGEGLPPGITLDGKSWDFFSGALDVVAHELSHGVTEYTSNLIYQNESGALNEAFSDIMSIGVEFFFQPTGNGPLRADYSQAEDIARPGGLRSASDPQSLGNPDHYSRRFLGSDDNGGVHINCTIATHAFYLAIEGGTNRTSGLSVQGVGAANREQIERVFYRAFTQMLPANATFAVARAATIQSARDLFGAGGAAERAVSQAWTAVGVN
jgi:bacillolysin